MRPFLVAKFGHVVVLVVSYKHGFSKLPILSLITHHCEVSFGSCDRVPPGSSWGN